MTDRELLELAAKAAGLPVEFDCEVNDWFANGRDDDGDVVSWWNPLADDGDALRLAVDLGLFDLTKLQLMYVSTGEVLQDEYAATRRAIVRAAAEIGKDMS